MTTERIVCRTPTPGKQPTRIERWKYELVHRAILEAVPMRGDGIAARELAAKVGERLSATERDRLGSVNWYTTTVRLELEVAGELLRLDRRGPVTVVRP